MRNEKNALQYAFQASIAKLPRQWIKDIRGIVQAFHALHLTFAVDLQAEYEANAGPYMDDIIRVELQAVKKPASARQADAFCNRQTYQGILC